MDTKRTVAGFCTFCGSLVVALIQSIHPDWFGHHPWILPASFSVLFVGLTVWICQYSWMQKALGLPHPQPSADPAELEQAIDKILSRKGILPDPPKPVPQPVLTQASEASDPIFDGEVSSIARAHKVPFYEMTRQLAEIIGKTDFAIDMDIIVSMYLVNVSPVPQYVRDMVASIEIDGQRVQMIRQNNFDAWDLNGTDYEYCLDTKPEQSHLRIDEKGQRLTPLLPSVPIELAPRQPLRGWVRFLLEHVNPDKLENNTSYAFAVKDSLGKEHRITGIGQTVAGNVVAWEKKVRK